MSQEATLLEIRELESEYEILGELGRGGMAIVYLARDRQLGRQVAIKVIHAAVDVDEEAMSRQLTEARTVAQLQHPNVVAIYAVKKLSTLGLALVMQYVPGRTLERAMREDGTFSPERTEAVLTDIAASLAYAHARGVIHRDIKPDNVFLNDETGRALLSDFGIALSAEAGRQAPLTDLIVGTPAYMSPEQIDGVELDGRSDLFSLGLVGYEMLTGVRPWVDESISDVMYRQKFELLPSLAEVRPDTPDRLRVAIERALEKDREDRWPTAAGFLGALTDDEWMPDDRDPAPGADGGGSGEGAMATRIANQLASRGARAAAGGGSQLQTMLYRRDAAATPRTNIPAFNDTPAHRGRRAVMLGLGVMLVAGAAAAFIARPDLPRRALDLFRQASADRNPRAQEQALEAFRDSVGRAETLVARHAVDSAAAAATVIADSSNALNRDSLVMLRDSLLRAAADAKRQIPLPTPQVTRSTVVPVRARDSAARAPAPPPTPAAAEVAATPIRVPVPSPVVAGGTHTCALVADGSVMCWGGNDRGQLGIGSAARKPTPTRVGGDVPFQQVSAGIAHSCAVSRQGVAYCWGNNDFGQLGDSATDARQSPSRVVGTHAYRVVATGTTHTCGLTTTNEIWCWGRNLYGQLGDGSTQDRQVPVRVESAARFVALTVGWNHSCALDAVGQAYCWGQNASGQLGDGTTIVRAVPTAVGGGLLFRSISAGGSHTCGVTTAGQGFCWGRDNAGQLGSDGAYDHTSPSKVATGLTFMDITAGGVHSCALTPAGEAYCWGRNSYGQLGDGSTSDRPAPVKVQGTSTFTAIHASGAHTCATATAGGLYCWGNNSDGQLGDGTTNDRSAPVPVNGAR